MFILREMVFFFFWRISKELMILMYDFCHFPRIVISRIVACFEQFWGRSLTIRVVDSGWKGPYSRHGLVIVLCCRARRFTLILSLSTQEYFWVLANCQGNLTKQWWGGVGWGEGWPTMDKLTISGEGRIAIPLGFCCNRNWDKVRPDVLLCLVAGFTLNNLIIFFLILQKMETR